MQVDTPGRVFCAIDLFEQGPCAWVRAGVPGGHNDRLGVDAEQPEGLILRVSPQVLSPTGVYPPPVPQQIAEKEHQVRIVSIVGRFEGVGHGHHAFVGGAGVNNEAEMMTCCVVPQGRPVTRGYQLGGNGFRSPAGGVPEAGSGSV